jgi:hypothetical protein
VVKIKIGSIQFKEMKKKNLKHNSVYMMAISVQDSKRQSREK